MSSKLRTAGSEGSGFSECGGDKYRFERLLIGEQVGLLRHHEVLGRCVSHPFDIELMGVALAEDAGANVTPF